jgi:hypothetical protein
MHQAAVVIAIVAVSIIAHLLGASTAYAGAESCEWDEGMCYQCGRDSCQDLGLSGDLADYDPDGGESCWVECEEGWRSGWDIIGCTYCEEYQ